MKQAAFQLKTRIHNVNIMNNNAALGKVIFNAMLSTLGILALLYLLILGNIVFNIVQRRTLEKEALTLSNEVGDLELSYLSVSGSVDTALSSQMGFKETKPTFATRKTLGSIKLANNEI